MEDLEHVDETFDDGWENDDDLLDDLLDVDLKDSNNEQTEDEKKEFDDDDNQGELVSDETHRHGMAANNDENRQGDNNSIHLSSPTNNESSGFTLFGQKAIAAASRGILSNSILTVGSVLQNTNGESFSGNEQTHYPELSLKTSQTNNEQDDEDVIAYNGGLLINRISQFFPAARRDELEVEDGWDNDSDNLLDLDDEADDDASDFDTNENKSNKSSPSLSDSDNIRDAKEKIKHEGTHSDDQQISQKGDNETDLDRKNYGLHEEPYVNCEFDQNDEIEDKDKKSASTPETHNIDDDANLDVDTYGIVLCDDSDAKPTGVTKNLLEVKVKHDTDVDDVCVSSEKEEGVDNLEENKNDLKCNLEEHNLVEEQESTEITVNANNPDVSEDNAIQHDKNDISQSMKENLKQEVDHEETGECIDDFDELEVEGEDKLIETVPCDSVVYLDKFEDNNLDIKDESDNYDLGNREEVGEINPSESLLNTIPNTSEKCKEQDAKDTNKTIDDMNEFNENIEYGMIEDIKSNNKNDDDVEGNDEVKSDFGDSCPNFEQNTVKISPKEGALDTLYDETTGCGYVDNVPNFPEKKEEQQINVEKNNDYNENLDECNLHTVNNVIDAALSNSVPLTPQEKALDVVGSDYVPFSVKNEGQKVDVGERNDCNADIEERNIINEDKANEIKIQGDSPKEVTDVKDTFGKYEPLEKNYEKDMDVMDKNKYEGDLNVKHNIMEATSRNDIQDDVSESLERNEEQNIDADVCNEWSDDDLDDCDLNIDDEPLKTYPGHNIQNSTQEEVVTDVDADSLPIASEKNRELDIETDCSSKCNVDSELEHNTVTPIEEAEFTEVNNASIISENLKENFDAKKSSEVDDKKDECNVIENDDEKTSEHQQEDLISTEGSDNASKKSNSNEKKDLHYDDTNEWNDDLDECDLDIHHDVTMKTPQDAVTQSIQTEIDMPEHDQTETLEKNEEQKDFFKRNCDWNDNTKNYGKIFGTKPSDEFDISLQKASNFEECLKPSEENNEQSIYEEDNGEWKDDLDECDLDIDDSKKSFSGNLEEIYDVDTDGEEDNTNNRNKSQTKVDMDLEITQEENSGYNINHKKTSEPQAEMNSSNFQHTQTIPPIIAEVPNYYLEKLLPTEPVAMVTDKGKRVKIDFTKLLQNEITKRLVMEKELVSHLERISSLEQDVLEKNKVADNAAKMEQIIEQHKEQMKSSLEGWEREKAKMVSEAQNLKEALAKVKIESKETIDAQAEDINELKLKIKTNDEDHLKLENDHKQKISDLTTQLQGFEASKSSTSKLFNEITEVKEKLESKSKYCEELGLQVHSLQSSLTETKLVLFDKSKEYEKKMESYESLLKLKEKDHEKEIENKNNNIFDLSRELELLKQDNSLSSNINELTQELAEKNQICNEMKSKINNLEQIRFKLEAESFDVTKKHARKTRELEETISKNELNKDKLKEELQESKMLYEEISLENNALHNEVRETKTNLNEKSSIAQDLQKQVDQLQAELKKGHNQKDARLSQLNNLHEAEVRTLNENKNELEKELINQKLSNTAVQHELKSLTSEYAKFKEIHEAMNKKAETLEQAQLDNETKVQLWEQKYKIIVEEKDHLESDLEEILVQMGLQKEMTEEDMIESENKISSLELHIEELIQENRQAHELHKEEIHSLQLSNNALTEKLQDVSNNYDTIVAKLDNEKEKCDGMSVEIQKLKQVNIDLDGQIGQLQMTVNLIEEQSSNDQTIPVAEWEERYNVVNEELANQKKELDELRSMRNRTNSEKDLARLRTLESTVQTQINSLNQKEKIINDLKTKASNLDIQLSTALEDKSTSEKKLSETKQLYDEMKVELSERTSQIEKMEVDLLSSGLELNAKQEKSLSVENYMKELDEAKKVIVLKDNDILNLQLHIESLKGDLISTQSKLAEKVMSGGIQYSQEEIEEVYESEIALLKDKLLIMESNMSKNEIMLKESLDKNTSLQLDVEKFQETLATKELEAIALQKKVDDLESDLGLTQEEVHIPEPGSREEAESVDFMREQIIFLATALEKAETQRAEAMDRIIAERKANADTIKRLKESVKRFYSTFSCTESAP